MRSPAEAAYFTTVISCLPLPQRLHPEERGKLARNMHKEKPMTLRNVTRNLAAGIAAGIVLIATQSAFAADDRGSVQGVVNDASGQPVTGAFVKLKNADRRLTFLVISQNQGRFEAKDLPVGKYIVQGVGGGYESEWFSNVSVTTNDAAKVGLAL